MKSMRALLLLACFALASANGFALVMVDTISKERAEKEFAASIRTQASGTNEVGVWLEFTPKGKLATFESIQLDITDGDRKLVTTTLSTTTKAPNVVAVYFATDPAYLSGSSFTLYYKIESGFPPLDGIKFNVKDFLKQ